MYDTCLGEVYQGRYVGINGFWKTKMRGNIFYFCCFQPISQTWNQGILKNKNEGKTFYFFFFFAVFNRFLKHMLISSTVSFHWYWQRYGRFLYFSCPFFYELHFAENIHSLGGSLSENVNNDWIYQIRTRKIIQCKLWPRTPHSWWRHQMETFSALLALCAGNSPVTGEFPAQRPVTRNFDGFFLFPPEQTDE